MAPKNKYRVRVRVKVRNKVLRRGGAAAGLALGLFLASWFFGTAFKASRDFLGGRFFSFRPASFEVDCSAPAAAAYARELMAKTLNAPLTAGRCAGIAAELRRRHPSLVSVSVGRNFFTKKASVTARPEEVVSPVLLNGATSYLGVTGRFIAENLGPAAADLPTVIAWPAGEAPALAAFLKELKPLLPLFYSRPALLECPGRDWACRLRLEDGSTVLWGKFEFTRLKILRLNEVARDAVSKGVPPFRVDMRYFREGKIFVSAAK
ncbi:MAG: hypothetical protein A2X35_04245 [Elusimicrobia bacterium GWA2_61_42]|nr:MAG: hypothetical protein A2X35_04245 [Elusimicrobia bacterium GWA2_61_42]OGR74611.1 MAG: hypothetical protein A2X38_05450 [Elusimicrobia bacterium GWC2_61_25]